MSTPCPLCERDALSSSIITETLRYRDVELHVPDIEIATCSACGEEVVLPEQARRNALRFTDAKRQHDQLLDSTDIIAWRQQMGWTQAEAARLLGGGANAFSKYERGEVTQARSMDLLMRITMAIPEARALLEDYAASSVPPPRRRALARCLPSGWELDEYTVPIVPVIVTPAHRVAANQTHPDWHAAYA